LQREAMGEQGVATRSAALGFHPTYLASG
jgi:hypothetical protein